MQKRLILNLFLSLGLLTSSFTSLEEGELKWLDWNTGYKKGMKENKIILVDAYTEWCGWCKRMDKDTYSNQDIVKKINKHFIPIKFNPELQQTYYIDSASYSGRELHAMLSKGQNTGYPTTYFLIPSIRKLYINPGYEDAEKFNNTLDRILKEAGVE